MLPKSGQFSMPFPFRELGQGAHDSALRGSLSIELMAHVPIAKPSNSEASNAFALNAKMRRPTDCAKGGAVDPRPGSTPMLTKAAMSSSARSIDLRTSAPSQHATTNVATTS